MTHFKIAAAQVASVRGDIVGNIGIHAAAIEAAPKQEVSMLVFPELSLTGYESDLAAELAITAEDPRLQPLISLARQHRIEVVLGAPLDCGHGIRAVLVEEHSDFVQLEVLRQLCRSCFLLSVERRLDAQKRHGDQKGVNKSTQPKRA